MGLMILPNVPACTVALVVDALLLFAIGIRNSTHVSQAG